MLKNITPKLIKITIITLLIILTNITITNAGTWNEIIDGGANFINTGKQIAGADINDSDLKDVSSTIYNVVFIIGVVLIVIVGVILGIQLMMASAEDKAKVKEALVPYFIGSVVIFSAFGIWKLCVQIFSQI